MGRVPVRQLGFGRRIRAWNPNQEARNQKRERYRRGRIIEPRTAHHDVQSPGCDGRCVRQRRGRLGRSPRPTQLRTATAEFTFTQYHNQTADSSLHIRLTEMWTAVRNETRGRVEVQVFPLNNNIQGSDPAALKLLVAGDIQFFTLMGGLLSAVVPVADVQQVPFAFRSAPHAHQAMDGALGAFIRDEMRAKGIHGFEAGAFDNGMRQIGSNSRPVVAPADLKGMRMRGCLRASCSTTCFGRSAQSR